MKIYLTGPREGQTVEIRNVKFVNGVAEHHCLPKLLERYYGVSDKAPKGFVEEVIVQPEDMNVNNEQEEEVNNGLQEKEEGQEELRKVIEQKKAEISEGKEEEKSLESHIEHMESLAKWPKMKSYVKSKTGRIPKNKKQGIEFLKDYYGE